MAAEQNRQERLLMRMRGAAIREVKNTSFAFSFSAPIIPVPTPLLPRKSTRTRTPQTEPLPRKPSVRGRKPKDPSAVTKRSPKRKVTATADPTTTGGGEKRGRGRPKKSVVPKSTSSVIEDAVKSENTPAVRARRSSRLTRVTSTQPPASQLATEVDAAVGQEHPEAAQSTPPVTGKRKRGKKNSETSTAKAVEDPGIQSLETVASNVTALPVATPSLLEVPSKLKATRGRPRKIAAGPSSAVQLQSQTKGVEDDDAVTSTSTAVKRKRGRPRKDEVQTSDPSTSALPEDKEQVAKRVADTRKSGSLRVLRARNVQAGHAKEEKRDPTVTESGLGQRQDSDAIVDGEHGLRNQAIPERTVIDTVPTVALTSDDNGKMNVRFDSTASSGRAPLADVTNISQEQSEPSATRKPANKKRQTSKGKSIQITVYHPEKPLAPIAEEDEEDNPLSAPTKKVKRSAVKAVDVFAQVSNEAVVRAVRNLPPEVKKNQGVPSKSSANRKRKAGENYDQELDVRLKGLAQAKDGVADLRKQVQEAIQEKLKLREELMSMRRRREMQELELRLSVASEGHAEGQGKSA